MSAKATLASQLEGKVLTPGDDGYEESLKRWASNFEKRAEYVVYVKSLEDISKTILWATENRLELAVKCGGHSGIGLSSTEGVVLDLGLLSTVKVDAEKQLAYAQGGALWSDFDKATTSAGFASVGGTVDHTGLGGLITGGGYGFLTGQYGLAIDNLVEVTMVLADGRIVKANEIENPDLFWGVRGGGGNFGVVYQFVLRIHRHPGTCFGGFMVHTPDKIPQVVSAFHKFWSNVNPKCSCHIVVSAMPPENVPMVIVAPFCDTTDESEARAIFADFYEIGPVADMTKLHPYVEQNKIISSIQPHGPRTYMKGWGYHDMSVELLQHAYDRFSSYVSQIGADYQVSAIAYEAYPPDKLCQVPREATAFGSRGRHLNGIINLRWQNPEHDSYVQQFVRTFVDDNRAIDAKIAQENGRAPVGNVGYGNFALVGDTAPEWFGSNLARLRELKKKWDPRNRFSRGIPMAS